MGILPEQLKYAGKVGTIKQDFQRKETAGIHV